MLHKIITFKYSFLLKFYSSVLREHSSNPLLDSESLIAYFFNTSSQKLFMQESVQINYTQLAKLSYLFICRANSRPLEYMTCKRNFYRDDFIVSPEVLIPRCETEMLVDLIIQSGYNNALAMLEIGVGSGCIITSLAKWSNIARLMGIDVSNKCVSITKKNIDNLIIEKSRKNNIIIILADFFKFQPRTKFDLIVSNPPYIESSQIDKLQNSVRLYEPHLALDGGTDGLDYYRHLATFGLKYLNNNGAIFLEINADLVEQTVAIFKNNKYKTIEIRYDLTNRPRFLIVYL